MVLSANRSGFLPLKQRIGVQVSVALLNRVCGVIGNISHCHCEVRGSNPPYPATQLV